MPPPDYGRDETMKVLRKRTFTCNGEGEYPGYECEAHGQIFPAFTMEQMEACAEAQDELGRKYGFDTYAHLQCSEGVWYEMYLENGDWVIWEQYEPWQAEGMALYDLGYDWPWDL